MSGEGLKSLGGARRCRSEGALGSRGSSPAGEAGQGRPSAGDWHSDGHHLIRDRSDQKLWGRYSARLIPGDTTSQG